MRFSILCVLCVCILFTGCNQSAGSGPSDSGGNATYSSARDASDSVVALGMPLLNPSQVDLDLSDGKGTARVVPIQVSNVGTGPLSIIAVNTSCSCAIVDSPPFQTLEPGASTEFSVRVHLPQSGTSRQSVRVAFKNSVVGDVHLPIQMNGKPLTPPYVHIRPPSYMTLKRLAGDGRFGGEFTFTTIEATEKPWTTKVRCDQPGFSASLIPKTLTSESNAFHRLYSVQIECLLRPGDGAIDGQIVTSRVELETEDSTPIAYATVACENRPQVRVIPSVVRATFEPNAPSCVRDILLQFIEDPGDVVVSLDAPTDMGLKIISVSKTSPLVRRIRLEVSRLDAASVVAVGKGEFVKFAVGQGGHKVGFRLIRSPTDMAGGMAGSSNVRESVNPSPSVEKLGQKSATARVIADKEPNSE